MERIPLFSRVLFGRTVWQRSRAGDMEYQRKAAVLVTLNLLALAMLALFACIAFARADLHHALINALVLLLVAAGFVHMRQSGNLAASTLVVLVLLSVQFSSDFASDTYRAMWSYTIPVLCFFLLGTRRGSMYAAGYFAVLLALMVWGRPSAYPLDFHIRFTAIYFSISVFSYFYEQTRDTTQTMLYRSRSLVQLQREVSATLAAGDDITASLQRALETILHVPPIDCGGVYLLERATGALRLVAHAGLPPEFTAIASHYPPDDLHSALVRAGVPQYTTYRALGVPILDREPLRAIAVIPVAAQGTVVGALNVSSHTADEIPLEVRVTLESIASDAGGAIRRMTAVEDLRALSARNDAILSAVPDIIMEVDDKQVYTWANKAGCAFFGDDVVGREAAHFFVRDQKTSQGAAPLLSGSGDSMYVESWQRRKDGEARLLAWWCRPLRDGAGRATGMLSSARDITESRRLEEQLAQAQKMDAIGQLAGGIAHDFNNQLGVVAGFTEMISRRVQGDEKVRGYVEKVLTTTRRAADLTAKLLAFARKGAYQLVRVDLHQIIGEVIAILKHTIDKRIVITQHLAAGPAVVLGDPSQLQGALLNLALNARDAMPEGGELVFSTALIDLDEDQCRRLPYALPVGPYVRSSVSDTGCGMDSETLKHIFEPFFTTKEKGKGTGLGLSAVYGIVKAHHGAVAVESRPGRGTSVVVDLPAVSGPAVPHPAQALPADTARRAKLRILVVEDEPAFREMLHDMLGDLGHAVVERADGRTAVEYYRNAWKETDLVVLDMVMPDMGGRETFTAMRAINPQVRVVLASGYSVDGDAQRVLHEGARGFIQKPFRSAELAEAIGKAMH